jgi:hypothetical protein
MVFRNQHVLLESPGLSAGDLLQRYGCTDDHVTNRFTDDFQDRGELSASLCPRLVVRGKDYYLNILPHCMLGIPRDPPEAIRLWGSDHDIRVPTCSTSTSGRFFTSSYAVASAVRPDVAPYGLECIPDGSTPLLSKFLQRTPSGQPNGSWTPRNLAARWDLS